MQQTLFPFLWRYMKNINKSREMSNGEETSKSVNEEVSSAAVEMVLS